MKKHKKIISFSILFFIFIIFLIYNEGVVPLKSYNFVKKTIIQGKKSLEVPLTLKRDNYCLRMHYYPTDRILSAKLSLNGLTFNQEYKFYRKKQKAVMYANIPKEIVKDGVNLLEVKFEGEYPKAIHLRIREYRYSFLNFFYIFPTISDTPSLYKVIEINNYKLVMQPRFTAYIIILTTFFFIAFQIIKTLFKKYINNAHPVNLKERYLQTHSAKNHKIKIISNFLLFGFIAAVIVCIYKSVKLGYSYPNNTFLFNPNFRFSDFLDTYKHVKDLDPYSFGAVYFPFSYILMYPFTLMPKVISYFLFLLAWSTFFIYINLRNLCKNLNTESVSYLFIFTFLSYPFLFVVDRGNIEMLTFAFTYLFFYSYKKNYIISLLSLSFAIAMKLFPAVFLLFLIEDKKYKEIILTTAAVIFISLVSMLLLKGDFSSNLSFILRGSDHSQVCYLAANNNIVQRGVSLFTLAKMYLIQTGQIAIFDMAKFLSVYIRIVISLFILLSGYVIFIEKEFWKKVFLLVSVALLFPHASADYKLIYIFIPMFMFINSEKQGRFDLLYTVIFGLLLIPKPYYMFPKIISDSGYRDIGAGVVINILLLMAMTGLIIFEGIHNIMVKKQARTE